MIATSSVYFSVARQFFIPVALLSVVPLTVAILFSLGVGDVPSSAPDTDSVASEDSVPEADEG